MAEIASNSSKPGPGRFVRWLLNPHHVAVFYLFVVLPSLMLITFAHLADEKLDHLGPIERYVRLMYEHVTRPATADNIQTGSVAKKGDRLPPGQGDGAASQPAAVASKLPCGCETDPDWDGTDQTKALPAKKAARANSTAPKIVSACCEVVGDDSFAKGRYGYGWADGEVYGYGWADKADKGRAIRGNGRSAHAGGPAKVVARLARADSFDPAFKGGDF